MATVAVVFHSAGGTTRQLANSISSGVVSLGGVELLELEIVAVSYTHLTLPTILLV